MSASGKLYGLFVGINDYQSEAVNQLRYAVADVLGFRELLRDRADLLDEHSLVLTQPSTGSTGLPTRKGLLEALDRLAAAPMRPEDTFLLYFAGHGFAMDDVSYLLTVDSNPISPRMLRETAVSLQTVSDFVRELKAGQQLLILDACRNRPTKLQRGAPVCLDQVMARDICAMAGAFESATGGVGTGPGAARAIVSACWEGQTSFEYPTENQGWFSFNLMRCMREYAGDQLDVAQMVETVRERMTQRAWQEFPEARGQEPHVVVEGRPIRLRLRALPTQPAAISEDPAKVQVKEVNIAPLQVTIEKMAAAQVQMDDLLPIPVRVLETEGMLLGVEQAIKQLENGTHESLLQAKSAVDEAKAQWQRLAEDLATNRHGISKDVEKTLSKFVAANPMGKPTQMVNLAPGVQLSVLLPLIQRLKNVDEARRAMESGQEQLQQMLQQKTGELKARRKELATRLTMLRTADASGVLTAFLQKHTVGKEFPLEAYLQMQPKLAKRRWQLNERKVLKLAEELWDVLAGRPTSKADAERIVFPAVAMFIAQHRTWDHEAWIGFLAELRKKVPVATMSDADVGACLEKVAERQRKKVQDLSPLSAPEAQQVQHAAATALGVAVQQELDIGGGVKAGFVFIPPGNFQMGSPWREERRSVNEEQHCVRLTRPFYLGETPVTQRQWEAVMGNNPSCFKGGDLPVERVTWDDAIKFCKGVSTKTGKRFRLPTEAEWEYACRAGTTGSYAGTGRLKDMGWCADNSGDAMTHPVGQKSPNAWGLYDMHGNVCEWCDAEYRDYPAGAVDDPKGGASGYGHCVVRGGSWCDDPQNCRSAYRSMFYGYVQSYNLGFRLVLDLP